MQLAFPFESAHETLKQGKALLKEAKGVGR
jgi:hypothetical protein